MIGAAIRPPAASGWSARTAPPARPPASAVRTVRCHRDAARPTRGRDRRASPHRRLPPRCSVSSPPPPLAGGGWGEGRAPVDRGNPSPQPPPARGGGATSAISATLRGFHFRHFFHIHIQFSSHFPTSTSATSPLSLPPLSLPPLSLPPFHFPLSLPPLSLPAHTTPFISRPHFPFHFPLTLPRTSTFRIHLPAFTSPASHRPVADPRRPSAHR